jgi:hypothetical protein
MADVKQATEEDFRELRALTEEELHRVKQRQEAMDKLFAENGKAKYKLEILFGKEYSLIKPCPGGVSFWESGAKLHGGGDAALHICPGKRLGRNNCEAFIPSAANGLGFLVCPGCGVRWQGEEVTGQILARLPIHKWADLLLTYFYRLQGNCDLVMKYTPRSIIDAQNQETERSRGGELLERVRSARQTRVYPLDRIIKDTAAGADMRQRILAFLRA